MTCGSNFTAVLCQCLTAGAIYDPVSRTCTGTVIILPYLKHNFICSLEKYCFLTCPLILPMHFTFLDANECDSNVCATNANCIETGFSSFTCICNRIGFIGDGFVSCQGV